MLTQKQSSSQPEIEAEVGATARQSTVATSYLSFAAVVEFMFTPIGRLGF
jgi:hypothetical protein